MIAIAVLQLGIMCARPVRGHEVLLGTTGVAEPALHMWPRQIGTIETRRLSSR
jgi:hypothetical protein